jgi:hypothetical protein
MKTPEQNIVQTLKGKTVLFLENDLDFSDYGGQTEFVEILKRNNIEFKALFNLSEDYTIEQIVSEILSHDCIVFMTQWVYDIAHKLRDFMFELKQPKIVIEIHVGKDPTWYYKPEGIAHDLYAYQCLVNWGEADKETETFYKITDKAYWDYENEFDA